MKKETMTSRERVLRAVSHKEADRVPIDLGMHFSTGISAFAYYNLREYLGLDTSRIEMPDMVQLLARVDDDIIERFHIDTVLVNPPYDGYVRWNPRGRYVFDVPEGAPLQRATDGGWTMGGLRMPAGGFFFDGGWPSFHTGDFIAKAAANAERLYKETDKFTVYMQLGAFFGGIEHACAMYTDSEAVEEQQEKALEHELSHAGEVIRRMGGYIQGIALNADLGTQQSPMIKPDMFDRFVMPYLSRLCSFIHRNSDLKIFLHSCGSIEPLLGSIAECGVDIISPVQISAENMDPAVLKGRYGDKLTFWGGGCDCQHVLSGGTPEDVRRNVGRLMETFKPGGGFVFNQVHNIMGDVPPEKIIAMLDAAYENAFY
ncbi:MAG: uroporphyrinogen decarboxylase family protein [Eubacteriales bacterium]|nr:uroporphyrinogen decarboxylase family protein [Eubacteriales bacterium]